MYRSIFRAGGAAVAIALAMPPAGALAMGGMLELAQNAPDTDRGLAGASQPPLAPPANAPEQVRRAQVELKRLDCLAGRIDGKLGSQTREAVKKFWASAKKPVVEVAITDELIAELAERGDNFCRPPRPFFSFGGRGGMPMFAPGVRPIPAPAPPARPASPVEP
jgi:peptidoglycan hydrolase-like protein with peptidoglycan-binding domain